MEYVTKPDIDRAVMMAQIIRKWTNVVWAPVQYSNVTRHLLAIKSFMDFFFFFLMGILQSIHQTFDKCCHGDFFFYKYYRFYHHRYLSNLMPCSQNVEKGLTCLINKLWSPCAFFTEHFISTYTTAFQKHCNSNRDMLWMLTSVFHRHITNKLGLIDPFLFTASPSG